MYLIMWTKRARERERNKKEKDGCNRERGRERPNVTGQDWHQNDTSIKQNEIDLVQLLKTRKSKEFEEFRLLKVYR